MTGEGAAIVEQWPIWDEFLCNCACHYEAKRKPCTESRCERRGSVEPLATPTEAGQEGG